MSYEPKKSFTEMTLEEQIEDIRNAADELRKLNETLAKADRDLQDCVRLVRAMSGGQS